MCPPCLCRDDDFVCTDYQQIYQINVVDTGRVREKCCLQYLYVHSAGDMDGTRVISVLRVRNDTVLYYTAHSFEAPLKHWQSGVPLSLSSSQP